MKQDHHEDRLAWAGFAEITADHNAILPKNPPS
jgi:hypothetical protein